MAPMDSATGTFAGAFVILAAFCLGQPLRSPVVLIGGNPAGFAWLGPVPRSLQLSSRNGRTERLEDGQGEGNGKHNDQEHNQASANDEDPLEGASVLGRSIPA